MLQREIAFYTDYVKIESHIEISKNLFLIDKRGKHILSELDAKKCTNRRRNNTPIFDDEIAIIYNNLTDVLNIRRFSTRLYSILLNLLDQLLFHEITEYDAFFIEDKQFELTQLYFDQTCWIPNQDIQQFSLDKSESLDAGENMCIICYIRDFEEILNRIEAYVIDSSAYSLNKNIMKAILKIRNRLNIVLDKALDTLNKKFEIHLKK